MVGTMPGLWARVLPRFGETAGLILVAAVRRHLGTEDVYTLKPAYAERKPMLKQYRHVDGKPGSQPLILSGELYFGLTFEVQGNCLVVKIEDDKAVDESGFDYAERWEQTTHFLEQGLADVEHTLAGILGTIIAEELFQ